MKEYAKTITYNIDRYHLEFINGLIIVPMIVFDASICKNDMDALTATHCSFYKKFRFKVYPGEYGLLEYDSFGVMQTSMKRHIEAINSNEEPTMEDLWNAYYQLVVRPIRYAYRNGEDIDGFTLDEVVNTPIIALCVHSKLDSRMTSDVICPVALMTSDTDYVVVDTVLKPGDIVLNES